MTRVWFVTLEVRSDREGVEDWWEALGIEAPWRWNTLDSKFMPPDCFAAVKLEVEATRDSGC